MRTLCAAAVAVLLLSRPGLAKPLASTTVDLDGDGEPDALELTADGVVRIGGSRPGTVTVAPRAQQGRLAIGRHAGQPVIVVELGGTATREAVLIVPAARGWRIALRTPLGGTGLDDEYGVEVEATSEGVFRFQTRGGVRRCDGRRAYLFAELFDGRRFARLAKLPSFVPATAPTLAASLDTTTATPPMIYQARAASHQPGSGDAGGLSKPVELDDGQPTTFWREEFAASAGEGQFFTFEPRVAGAPARQVRIVPGNPTSAATMKSFNRPRAIAILGARTAWRVELPDAAREPLGTAYVVDLPGPIDGCVTVVLESTHGAARGTTAIAELQVFAEDERAAGGDAMLARVIAEGKSGAVTAAAALARRGAAGATALDAELARTTDATRRRRLIAALVKIQDPAAAPALARAAAEGWVTGPALLELIDALARNGLVEELAALAGRAGIELEARIAAASRLGPTGKELALLLELAGRGPHELRRAVIDRLALAPLDALVAGATASPQAAAAGDLWRALTRHARAEPADGPAALAAMVAALPAAVDYERRYRLVDGIATLGDAAALKTLAASLRALPEGAETAALRQVAIRAVGIAPRVISVGLVLAFARDADPGVRLAVVAAIAGADSDPGTPWHATGGPDGIDRMIINALATDTWPEVRRRAATALGNRCQRLGPARALGDAVAKDPEVDVRGDALIALVQCRAPGVDQLLARTWDDGKAPLQLRTQAVGLAVALGDPRLGAILVGKFARWRGAAIESAAAVALAQSAAASIALLDAPGAAQALTDALEDSAFPEIVSAAALALGELGPGCPPTAKAKLEVLARSDEQSATAARRAAAKCGR